MEDSHDIRTVQELLLRTLIPDLLAKLPIAKRGEVTWVGIEQRA